MNDVQNERIINACAHAAHEANRAYCIAHGDETQPTWDMAPDWQRSSARNGVIGVMNGNGPEQSHESWLAEKRANGWVYGPIKDPETKQHPCLVAYVDLPEEQRRKDDVFVAVVRAVLAATS